MGGDSNGRQACHHEFADAIVQNAFTIQNRAFLRVEGGCIILEILDEGAWLRPFIKDFRLALIDNALLAHADGSPDGTGSL